MLSDLSRSHCPRGLLHIPYSCFCGERLRPQHQTLILGTINQKDSRVIAQYTVETLVTHTARETVQGYKGLIWVDFWIW